MEALAIRYSVGWDEPASGRPTGVNLPRMDHLPDSLHAHTEDVSSFVHTEHVLVSHINLSVL